MSCEKEERSIMIAMSIFIAAGLIGAVIIIMLLIGSSISRLFLSDETLGNNSAASSPILSLAISRIEVSKASDNNTALIQTGFDIHNITNNTAVLDNLQYGLYKDNNTRIIFGSIGKQTDDVIQGQASVYPIIPKDTLKVSDVQTVKRSAVNNKIWNDIVNGDSNYVIRGIYTVRDNSELRAEGVQNSFDIAYPPSNQSNQAKPTATLSQVKSIPLTGVTGRIDHMSIDTIGKRLFIAELGNNPVDIIDLTSGKRLHTLNGLADPQGVLYLPKSNKIFVTNGGGGQEDGRSVQIYNGSSYSLIDTVKLRNDDADNIRYDNTSGFVYVGYGNGALAVFSSNGSYIADISSLPGHPESFQIEQSSSAAVAQAENNNDNKIFINIPTDHSIVVADKLKRSLITKWMVDEDASQNFPMALEEHNHRLFVGFRDPPKLIVYDTNSGKAVAKLDISKDADDIFYDNVTKNVYVSAGEGFIDIFKQVDSDHYKAIDKIQTGEGGRTSLFVPETRTLYVAIPQKEGIERSQGAEILVYQVLH